MKLSEHNLAKKIGYLNSSWKNTQFQKKNQLKWSPESEVINILNSTIFQGFSEKAAICTVSYFINPSSIFGFSKKNAFYWKR
jgi:hypothetical protein